MKWRRAFVVIRWRVRQSDQAELVTIQTVGSSITYLVRR